jgi:hypothetical protein
MEWTLTAIPENKRKKKLKYELCRAQHRPPPKSTGGVTRDPFYLFDISAAAKFLCDTLKISAFEPKILQFGACVTT